MSYIPPSWGELAVWQGKVAQSVNPLLQGYTWNWSQYTTAPTGVNEAYSYYDLTKHAPGWHNGTAYRYFVGADSSGNVSVSGTLTVTGATSLSSLSTSGNVTVGGTLGVTGASTLASLTVTGATALNTLSVNAVTGSGSITTTGAVGYRTGAGGTVTQATSKSTGVTLNKLCGLITMHNANLAAGALVSFTLTNSTIAAQDSMILSHDSGGTFAAYLLNARMGSGTATIDVRNITAGALAEAISIKFTVIKSVNS